MNKFLVELLPLWLAPNVITVSGLAFLVLGFILSAIVSRTLDEPVPVSLNVYVAFALFIYQTLGRKSRVLALPSSF
jgi:ethanolaminephosphotransferase